MKLVSRFLLAELAWATGIFLVLASISAMTESLSAPDLVTWLARALGLAAFPAGIAIARGVFGHGDVLRRLLAALAAASAVGAIVFVLTAVVAPAAGEPARSLDRLAQVMSAAGESWESRNDAAWRFYATFLAGLNALLFAAIGLQVGVWASYALPRLLERALYWAVGLGLLVSGVGIWDTTYETIVLHVAADASFAAFYTVLLPASVCAGLALPTLALVRRVDLARRPS
jgi:hypothetical protein